jgi:hypothetical protein
MLLRAINLDLLFLFFGRQLSGRKAILAAGAAQKSVEADLFVDFFHALEVRLGGAFAAEDDVLLERC